MVSFEEDIPAKQRLNIQLPTHYFAMLQFHLLFCNMAERRTCVMQLEIQTTDIERQTAAEWIATKRKIPRYAIGGGLLLLFFLKIIASLLRYGGKTPPLLLAARLAASPFLWLLALLAILLFASSTNPAKQQALHLFGLAMYRHAFTCQITSDGIACFAGEKRIGTLCHTAFTGVHNTGTLLLLTQKNTVLLILPLRCFETAQQAQQTEKFLLAKLATPVTAQLALPALPSLWQFSYWGAGATAFSAADIQNAALFKNKRWQRLFWVLFAADIIVLLLAVFLRPTLKMLPVYWLGLLFLFCTTAFARYKAGTLGGNAAWVPACLNGNCTLEVLEDGLRVYNQQLELFFGWEQPFQVLHGPTMALLTLYGSLFSCLPYAAGNWQTIHEALQYIAPDAATQI